MLLADDFIYVEIELFAAAPTPCPPTQAPISPSIPQIGSLTASILASDDVFLISHCVLGSTMIEWALFRVDLQRSVQMHPADLQDGRFIVDFYTCHPSDRCYNTINQRYWIKYHRAFSVADTHRKCSTHLKRPYVQSPEYGIAEGLCPFSQWVRLTNADTYISSIFNCYCC